MNGKMIVGVGMLGFFIWLITTQAAAAAAAIPRDQLLAMINRINAEFATWFDPLDVLAIIEIESSFNPDSYRYEKHIGDASIGLMQILYQTARDRGFTQGPAGLFDPETNIRYGMRQLKWSHDYLAGKFGTKPRLDQWIGSYNAGVGNVLRGNIPTGYVQKWVKARDRLEASHG